MRIPNVVAVGVLGLGLAAGAASPARAEESREPLDARMAWWIDARFGMFIHWDMSSLAGTEISWSRKGTKPLDITGHKAGVVEDPAYDNLYKRFNPEKFDAAAWMRLARDAGMKYVVFTAKHHGGFCMWDTKLTDYSIMNTPFRRDVVKELADACHKAGLRFGLYYSQRDWHHPDYGIGDNKKYVDTRGGPYRNGRWGGSTHKGNTVYLHVFAWGGDRLSLPPLKAKVLKAANLSDPQAAPALEQTAEAVVLTLAADRQDPVDTVLELTLDGPARDEMENGRPIEVAAGRPGATVKQAADGTLTLSAESAAVQGRTARLQDSGGRPNIGYWTDGNDSLRWSAAVAKTGTFAVELIWSCQPGAEGSEYTLSAGDRSITGKVEATKEWDDWRTAVVGELSLAAPGPVTVVLKPTRKPGAAVMNLAQVRLVLK